MLLYVQVLLIISFYMISFRHTLHSKAPYLLKCSACLMFLNIVVVLQMLISFCLVYSVPHHDLKLEPVYDTATQLLECAQFRLSSFSRQWNQIETCLTSVNIYYVTKGRVPYLRNVPTAFVFPNFDKNSVFVTPQYEAMSLVDKALVLIHECAHIGFNAVDHAYRWQKQYEFLSEKQHYENADSFMDAVLYHCL